jgi:SecD/SecF fusion protein
VTKKEAERGANEVRPPGTPVDQAFQRFAIVLDGRIVSLASVSFIDNPSGIDGSNGAQINTGGSLADAQQLARTLAAGQLPLDLQLVSGP